MALSPKINVADIVAKHISTLYDSRRTNGPLYWRDVVTFFIVPLALAIPAGFQTRWPASFLGASITLLGVLGGLLFNLLVIALEHARSLRRELNSLNPAHSARTRERLESMQELLYNISFQVLVSVAALAVALVVYLLPESGWFAVLARVLFVWFLGIFLVGLLLVLKRSHYLVVDVTG